MEDVKLFPRCLLIGCTTFVISFAGAMLGSGGDDDDDDDGRILRKLAKIAGRAMVGVPTEGLPGGTVATYLWDKFVAGENMYGRDPIEMGAPLAVIDEAVNIVSELVREDGPRAGRLGSSLADVMGAITTLPIPGLFATTSGAIDAFTAEATSGDYYHLLATCMKVVEVE